MQRFQELAKKLCYVAGVVAHRPARLQPASINNQRLCVCFRGMRWVKSRHPHFFSGIRPDLSKTDREREIVHVINC